MDELPSLTPERQHDSIANGHQLYRQANSKAIDVVLTASASLPDNEILLPEAGHIVTPKELLAKAG